jgi:hypothetical protein
MTEDLPGAVNLARGLKDLSEDNHKLAGFEWVLDEDLKELNNLRDIKSRLYEIGIDKIKIVEDFFVTEVLYPEVCEFSIKENVLTIKYKGE